MKGFAKKLFAVGISASIMLSTVMSVGVNAATEMLLNEDFTTKETLDSWEYTNTNKNQTQGEAFKWNNGLEIYTGKKDNGIDKIEKSFPTINSGDTLKITGKVSINELDWWAGQSAAIKIGNGTHNWSLLQIFSGNAFGVGAASKDIDELNGYGVVNQKRNDFNFSNYTWETDSDGLKYANDLNYAATLAPSANGYTLTASLGIAEVPVVSIELTEAEALSIDRIYVAVGTCEDYPRRRAIKLDSLQVKRIVSEKPVLTFGDNILFNNSGERLNENFAAWRNYSGVTADASDGGYSRGAKWLYTSQENNDILDNIFSLNEGELEVYIVNNLPEKKSGLEKLEKKFNPISSGDTLKITGKITLSSGLDWWSGQTAAIRIGNGRDNWTLLQTYNYDTNVIVGAASKNTDVYNGYEIVKHERKEFDLSSGASVFGEQLDYIAILEPSANGYTLTASLGIAGVQKVSIELSEEDALSLDRIYITSGFRGGEDKKCGLKIENLKVEAVGTKTALTNGTNTLYVPMKNLNGETANMTVIAALCNEDGSQESFAIKNCEVPADYSQNVAIDIDVDDCEKQFVRIFVFESVQSMAPLTDAKSTKN